jgi:hypothetical protein
VAKLRYQFRTVTRSVIIHRSTWDGVKTHLAETIAWIHVFNSMTPICVFSSKYAVWISSKCGQRAKQFVLFSSSNVYRTFTAKKKTKSAFACQHQTRSQFVRTPHRPDGYTVLLIIHRNPSSLTLIIHGFLFGVANINA